MFFNTVYAAGEAAAPQVMAQPTLLESMLPFLVIFFCFYFFMIRPQAKKAREHVDLLKTLKAGDEVVTTGGLIGRVKTVSEEFVAIESGPSHFKVLKEHIVRLTKTPAAKV